uniref:RPA12 n=1 Tax=Arundo donax TaxID=35708 RepID=A0A0A8XT28_ARUDO
MIKPNIIPNSCVQQTKDRRFSTNAQNVGKRIHSTAKEELSNHFYRRCPIEISCVDLTNGVKSSCNPSARIRY